MTQHPAGTANSGDAGQYEDEIEELARTQKLLAAMSAKQRSTGLYLQRPEAGAGVPREPHRAYSR